VAAPPLQISILLATSLSINTIERKQVFSQGTLFCTCVKVCEAIKLPFSVVSGMGLGIGVLDGVHVPQGEGEVLGVFLPHWFEWHF